MHPAAWVQCFPWTDLLLESWQVGAASVELQGCFGNVSAHSRHLTKLLGRFYSTCNLSASVVPLTLSSCFSCHIYLSCRRFIWGRQHDIFGLLRAQESRAGSLSTFRSVVLCLQMICKCNRMQCKGRTLWRNHICPIVLEKSQLCWDGLRVVTAVTLEWFWGAAFHLWTMLMQCLFYWGARNSRYIYREILFPTVRGIVRLTPLPPFYELSSILHWMRQHLSCTLKGKGNFDASFVFAASNW